ncbi:hypothetical protein K466DRAFT_604521 [Polyporus arcularius HHB13444]|uniref:Uncharacterized protein n=1 Tax=Polyporus arcularius HHB13444 TaxID=1314778 RepID=A0A5C3NVT5_9APHY|nr:hypothetical protein K466DRAFT_604521 [Polyporus arcularius HHB13444]
MTQRNRSQDADTHADAPEPPMDVDQASEHGESSARSTARKSKGKTRATTAEIDQLYEDAQDVPPERNEYDAWDSRQLLEARQESLRQALRDRAGVPMYGDPAHRDSQTDGAGPSRVRRDLNGTQNGMAPAQLSAVREDFASHAYSHYPPQSSGRDQYRHNLDGNNGYRDVAHGTPRPSYEGRAQSEYVPYPNTRAADFLAGRRMPQHHLPQRSPFSRVRGLRPPTPPGPSRRDAYERSASERQEYLPDLMQEENVREEQPHEEHAGLQHAADSNDWEGEVEEAWEQAQGREEGEVLPTALWNNAPQADALPTPVPDEGYPAIHQDDPEAYLRGMAVAWLREVWNDPVNTDVLLRVYNYRYTEDDVLNRRVAEGLRRAFEQITGETDFDVVMPEPEEGANRRSKDLPTLWAIRGLTARGTEIATSRGTWSFQTISFVAMPRATPTQTWLFALEGFLEGNTQKIRNAVLRVLQEEDMQRWMISRQGT